MNLGSGDTLARGIHNDAVNDHGPSELEVWPSPISIDVEPGTRITSQAHIGPRRVIRLNDDRARFDRQLVAARSVRRRLVAVRQAVLAKEPERPQADPGDSLSGRLVDNPARDDRNAFQRYVQGRDCGARCDLLRLDRLRGVGYIGAELRRQHVAAGRQRIDQEGTVGIGCDGS